MDQPNIQPRKRKQKKKHHKKKQEKKVKKQFQLKRTRNRKAKRFGNIYAVTVSGCFDCGLTEHCICVHCDGCSKLKNDVIDYSQRDCYGSMCGQCYTCFRMENSNTRNLQDYCNVDICGLCVCVSAGCQNANYGESNFCKEHTQRIRQIKNEVTKLPLIIKTIIVSYVFHKNNSTQRVAYPQYKNTSLPDPYNNPKLFGIMENLSKRQIEEEKIARDYWIRFHTSY